MIPRWGSSFLVAIVLFGVGMAIAAEPMTHGSAGDRASSPHLLFTAHWQAHFLGQTQSGQVCWISGSDDSYRVEILANDGFSIPWSHLLEQNGQGYTLVLAGPETGTMNPWQERWRLLHPGAARWIEVVLSFLESPAQDNSSMPSDLRVDLPRLVAVTLPEKPNEPSLAQKNNAGGFRGNMAYRGLGRGGNGEILTISRIDLEGQSAWEIVSTAKPGRIQISRLQAQAVVEFGPEAFAPLWPLSYFLELQEK